MKNILVLFILFILFSCGAKKNKSTPESVENLLLASHNEIRCESIKGQKNSPIINRINQLSQRIPEVQDKYLQFNGLAIDFTDQRFLPENGHNWTTPLILSEKEFEKLWNDLNNKAQALNTSLWPSFVNGKELTDQMFLEPKALEVREMIAELNYISSLAQRFVSYSCAKEELEKRRSDDVRSFLKLSNKSCQVKDSDDCIEKELQQYKGLSENRKIEIEQSLLNLCEKSEKRSLCEAHWFVALDQNTLNEFYSTYINNVNETTYAHLFELEHEHRKFNCKKRNDQVVMSVPFYAPNGAYSSYSEAYNNILAYTEKIWSNSQLKIEFYEGKDPLKSVQVIRTPGVISRVIKSAPLIVELSQQAKGEIAMKTFAHEFGHVLGFPDCYIEFFERENNQVVYYELDHERKNLMCSLRYGNKIPENYFKELLDKACL